MTPLDLSAAKLQFARDTLRASSLSIAGPVVLPVASTPANTMSLVRSSFDLDIAMTSGPPPLSSSPPWDCVSWAWFGRPLKRCEWASRRERRAMPGPMR